MQALNQANLNLPLLRLAFCTAAGAKHGLMLPLQGQSGPDQVLRPQMSKVGVMTLHTQAVNLINSIATLRFIHNIFIVFGSFVVTNYWNLSYDATRMLKEKRMAVRLYCLYEIRSFSLIQLTSCKMIGPQWGAFGLNSEITNLADTHHTQHQFRLSLIFINY